MIRRFALPFSLALVLAACGGGAKDDAEPDAAVTETAEAPAAEAAVDGETAFAVCKACHTVDKGGRNGVGPNLHGVAGRAVASVADFNYSPALKAKGGVWDDASLDAYIADPRKAAPGNKMAFAGVSDAARRKALVEYLKAQK